MLVVMRKMYPSFKLSQHNDQHIENTMQLASFITKLGRFSNHLSHEHMLVSSIRYEYNIHVQYFSTLVFQIGET